MSSEAAAIRVHDLGKCYRVYDRPQDRLKEYVLPRLPAIRSLSRKSWSKEFWALRNVSFEVARGETLGIIGRNGSGKSTLLQLICGTLDPSRGSIEVNGRVGALLELGAGFNPEFTGLENVYLGASLYGLSREETDRRLDRIAAFADIGDFLQRPVKTYSSGMYVRLAFALVAHIDADILVIDEALAVGDAYFVQKCMRFLRSFMERGTLLFVSHDLGAVANLCDRAILLRQGRVETSGEPKVVLEHYLASLCAEAGEVAEIADGLSDAPSIPNGHRDAAILPVVTNGSSLRSQFQVLGFDAGSSGFGTGRARIVSVKLQDQDGGDLTVASGGMMVNLQIICAAAATIDRPIIGFQLKDRLGQAIFGENTFLNYRFNSLVVSAGGEVEANFEFSMPFLPTGDYSFSVAIAEGSQETHVQHHWLHDALMISVHASSASFGLVGVPMTRISLITR